MSKLAPRSLIAFILTAVLVFAIGGMPSFDGDSPFGTDTVEASGPGTWGSTPSGFCLGIVQEVRDPLTGVVISTKAAGTLWDASVNGCSSVAFNPQYPVTSPVWQWYYASGMYWNDLYNSGLQSW